MDSEKKFHLFGKLKEEFMDATGFEDYSNIEVKFEIDEASSDDENLIVEVTIKTFGGKEISILVSIQDYTEKLEINAYEDVWEEWTSFDYNMQKLWQALFWQAIN